MNGTHAKSSEDMVLRLRMRGVRRMAQKPNPIVSGFRERVEWVVLNLDPDPTYRRFVAEVNDVFSALEEALETKSFAVGPYERVPGRRTWETALSSDGVPYVYLEWLYALYPDLVPSQLEADTLAEFFASGSVIQASRERWRPAIRHFAERRAALARLVKTFYANLDASDKFNTGDLAFPLLIQDGWIRSEPLLLKEQSEAPLHGPDPAPDFQPRILPGLRGDYVAYKGALAYATRRVVKSEPQHNGEIFSAKSVLLDSAGFAGFRYSFARYFDYINTCEVLGAELADWAIKHPDSSQLDETLPFRGSPEQAFDLTNRAAYPGVNCLSIFLNYSEAKLRRGNYFLLHKRDETQLQAQNSVHVVPAGGHQGYAKGGWRDDTAIWRTMAREFCEELFDQENLYKQPETWEDFLEFKEVKKIKQIFFDAPTSAATVYLHGFGLDPVTLKPEVLLTIIIDWDRIPKGRDELKLKFNWELQMKRKKLGTRHQWVRLSKSELLRQAKGRVQSIGDVTLETLPAGAACMMLTAKHYEFLGLPSDDH